VAAALMYNVTTS